MKLLKQKTHIDFIGKDRYFLALSVVLVVASITFLAIRGLNFGLDFTGGTLIEVSFPQAANIEQVRDNLQSVELGDAVVQTFGAANDLVVRIPPRSEDESSADISTLVLNALQQGVEGEAVMRSYTR